MGDESIAYRIEASGGFLFTATADTIAWRRGETISVVSVSGLGEPDRDLIRTLVRKADDRLAA